MAEEQGLSAENIVPPCTLEECPPGPFEFNGSLGFKTEYRAVLPRDIGGGKVEFVMSHWPDAFCMDSGEFFWGGAKTHTERAALIVQPVEVSRAEGLHPPVGVEEEVFSSLGASKAPSCGSPTVPETPSEEWPARGPDFNRWHSDAARFVRLVQDNPGFWLADFQVKYLQLNIDTRDGGFTLKDRDGVRIAPGRVVLAINKHRERFGRDVPPTNCQTSGGEA